MDRSLAVTLGIAAIAHAIVIGVMRPHVRHAVAPASPGHVERDIESQLVEIELPREGAAPSGGAVTPSPHVAITTGKPKSLGMVTPGVPEVPEAPAVSSGDLTAAPPAPSGDGTPKVTTKFPSLINLDAPGSHAVIFPKASDVAVSKQKAAEAKLDAQLKSALDAKDTEVGSGFGGPVVSAAHAAANPSGAMGWATFDVSTDALGTVTMVRVVDFGGGDSKSWQSVAKGIHATLGATHLRVPPGAAGVAVRIRVDAAMKYPSGATTPITPMIGAGTVGGSFDLADIGQPKRRIVQVRIVAEQRI